MPRSVPPRHWYDESLEQGDAPGSLEPGERDRRAPGGPASPARPDAAYESGSAGYGQEASYGNGPGEYRPDDPYQEPGYGQESSFRRAPAGYGRNEPYNWGDYTQNDSYDQGVDHKRGPASGQGPASGHEAPNGHGPANGYEASNGHGPASGYRAANGHAPANGYEAPNGHDPAGYQQDGRYDGGPAGYGQDTRWPAAPGGYEQDSSYQNARAGYDQDTRYQDSYNRDGRYNQEGGYGYAEDTQYQRAGYGRNDQYQDDRYQDDRYRGPGYGRDDQYQDDRYQRPGYGQDGPYEGGPYQDGPYQDGPYQGGQYQDGPGDHGQGPPDGQQPGDGPTRHRHNKNSPAGKLRRPHPLRMLRRLLSHRSVQALLVAFVIFLGWVGWSVGHALTVPGNGSVSTRLAEWARDHYLGPVVTLGEWLTYQAPKVGGKPQFSLAAPTTGTGSGTTRTGVSAFKPIVPTALTSLAGTPLPGEGQWRVLASVKGYPAIYGTYLRPDNVHTSYVAGIASMDQRLLKFQLRPGVEDPGGTNWGYSPYLPANSRTGLLATFNGGFKLDSAGGGFYLNGRTKGVLTTGAASLVYYRNGTVAIGSWGQSVSMNANVLGVRQNLKLIVDHGAVPAAVDQNVEGQWGATLGGGYYVWRSGIGITRDGRVVWVYGPALSVRTLANLLQRAGAVEGMQMDINPAWMSYMYYKPAPSVSNPTPANLLPDQPEPANRYYSINSRDFTAVFAR